MNARRTWAVARKEFLHVLRDPRALGIGIAIPMLLGMTLITFVAVNMTPGDFLAELRMNPQISKEVLQQYEREFHLDRPLIVQYGYWLANIAHGNLGRSFVMQQPVAVRKASSAWQTSNGR